ncbi:MAG: tetratricopeptide repeat protein [Nitrospirae bacterium]|nr:tetratricopeptide repeat protein [Nitrospirota bacterium]
MIEIPLKGNLKTFSLPKILSYLNKKRYTGTLIINTPVFTKKVFLIKGDAIFAASSYEDDRLGEMLIKAGKITLEQLDQSVNLLKQTGKRQGAILVELGYLTPKDLFWGVKYQVKEIIYSLFQLEDADYEFVHGEIPANEVITLKMSMGNLIYEGVKRIDNLTRVRNEMPPAESVLKLSTDPAMLFQDIELSSQDKKMISLINGKRTIKELVDSSWFGTFEAMKILYVLWSVGILEEQEIPDKFPQKDISEEPISIKEIFQPSITEESEAEFIHKVDRLYMSLNSLTEYELLEVERDADEETLKKNYYKLSREFHPDRYFSSSDPNIKDKLQAIFDTITKAYETLRANLMKEPSDSRMNIPDYQNAEEFFRKGLEESKVGQFNAAIDLFKKATELDPKNAKYWSYLSLSLVKTNNLKKAEEAIFKAINIQPDNADFYANLGIIYIKAGMKKKAYNQFKTALELDPENTKAKKGIDKTKN